MHLHYFYFTIVSIALVYAAPRDEAKRNGVRIPINQKRDVSRRVAGSAAEPLTSYASGTSWYGTVLVGTPPAPFNILMDTGSTNLWLPRLGCPWNSTHYYNPAASNTSVATNQTFSIKYVGNNNPITGYKFQDKVTVAGLTVPNQTFGAATTGVTRSASDPKDGTMGLNFPSATSWTGQPPFIGSLINQRVISVPQFGVKLSRTSGASELFLGGYNSALFTGSVYWTPVPVQSSWTVRADSISINGIALPGTTNTSILLDTGTTYIYGEQTAVASLYTHVPGYLYNSTDNSYQVPCNTTSTVSATFSGHTWPIQAHNYFVGGAVVGSSTMCHGRIYPRTSATWTLGGTFLMQQYNIFDVGAGRVGFATLA